TPRDSARPPVWHRHPPPPIWVGGNSSAAIRRAIAHGSGWSPFPATARTAAAVHTAAITAAAPLARASVRSRELAEDGGRAEPLDVCFTPFSHPAHKNTVDP